MSFLKNLALLSIIVSSIPLFASADPLDKAGNNRILVKPGQELATGAAGLRETLLKHGKVVPSELHAAAENPALLVEEYKKACTEQKWAEIQKHAGSEPTSSSPQGFVQYGEFLVGKSKLNLLIDTGSSDFWVYSNQLPKNVTKGHAVYNTSTGRKKKGLTWKIAYGDGSKAGGTVYADSVVAGSATATSQAVEVATEVSGNHISGVLGDGIAGLGQEQLNRVKPNKQKPLWQNVLTSSKDKVWTADLSKDARGTLDFGFIDPKKHTSPVVYSDNIPAHYPGYWWFKWDSYLINGTERPTNPYKRGIPDGLVDTGTAYLVIPEDTAAAYYQNIKDAKHVGYSWVFPCTSKVQPFGLKIKGETFYVYEQYMKQKLSHGLCFGSIQGAARVHTDGGDIIGAPFVYGSLVVFDPTGPRLGFAHKKLQSTK